MKSISLSFLCLVKKGREIINYRGNEITLIKVKLILLVSLGIESFPCIIESNLQAYSFEIGWCWGDLFHFQWDQPKSGEPPPLTFLFNVINPDWVSYHHREWKRERERDRKGGVHLWRGANCGWGGREPAMTVVNKGSDKDQKLDWWWTLLLHELEVQLVEIAEVGVSHCGGAILISHCVFVWSCENEIGKNKLGY